MAPLTPGTLRAHLEAYLRLPAVAGAGIGIVSSQYVDLLAGRPATFTREQLEGFFPLGALQYPTLPASYDAEAYTLTGDDTVEAVE
jgi:hypothetical protein